MCCVPMVVWGCCEERRLRSVREGWGSWLEEFLQGILEFFGVLDIF